MLLEEFKNCVSERAVVYLNEQKVTSLQQAAILADEYTLTHKLVFVRCEFAHPESSQKAGSPMPSAAVSTTPKNERQCFFCCKTGHLMTDCVT